MFIRVYKLSGEYTNYNVVVKLSGNTSKVYKLKSFRKVWLFPSGNI